MLSNVVEVVLNNVTEVWCWTSLFRELVAIDAGEVVHKLVLDVVRELVLDKVVQVWC